MGSLIFDQSEIGISACRMSKIYSDRGQFWGDNTNEVSKLACLIQHADAS